jgi:hypothetical protein
MNDLPLIGNVRGHPGDTHHRHAHGRPEAKRRQEPADPFLRISGVASPRKNFINIGSYRMSAAKKKAAEAVV